MKFVGSCEEFENLRLNVICFKYAPIAQLDRASDYESEGRAFESLWVRFSSFISMV